MTDYSKFENLGFDSFRELAGDASLSRHEKVGFPDAYREGKEDAIFQDILSKLPILSETGKTILDIGPGCSGLPLRLMELCEAQGHRLLFIDSQEMLDHLPDAPFVHKHPGRFPNVPGVLEKYKNQVDGILVYSVIQYVFSDDNIHRFFDDIISLLSDGGEVMIGDIPNVAMRKRFFASPAGVALHKEFTGKDEEPGIIFNQPEYGSIDDGVILGLLARARAFGLHAWVVPQAINLPMSNRREDLILKKP